ncbi:MAG: NAD-dependent epimerase/dehydratase family protein [Planctomycetota bacterium]|jgi:nucleoside-diphosphate-sugar epimerase|nr:NAD-dependent epimerase/dehydratase family protein [Planctomycetota bacterium]
MRCVVTGASGFVGRHLLRRLADHGHTGIASGRSPPTDLPRGWTAAARNELLPARLRHCDVVIHLEVKQHVPQPTAADIEAFEAVNVGGTRDWLEWATQNGVQRFVLTSSIKAASPDSPYGRSKVRAETAVSEWAASDPARQSTILRLAPVYGPGNEANLAAFVRQVIAGWPCLVGDGSVRKSVVSVGNVTAALEFVACRERPGGMIFTVTDPATLSLRELAMLIADLAGSPTPRGIPRFLAGCAAALGDVIAGITSREMLLTTARLRALDEESVFSSGDLVAAGFRHPQTTQDGLEELVASLTRVHS